MKFGVGDYVKIRSQKDMVCEYGYDKKCNYIPTIKYGFSYKMKIYCGNYFLIRDCIPGANYYVLTDCWNAFCEEMFEPIKYKKVGNEYIPINDDKKEC